MHLQEQKPYQDWSSLKRTLQRRVQQWKALHGPAPAVMFPLPYQPGEIGFSDFTRVNRVAITLRGEPFPNCCSTTAWPGVAGPTGRLSTAARVLWPFRRGCRTPWPPAAGCPKSCAPIASQPPAATTTAATPSTSRPATRPSAPITGCPQAGTTVVWPMRTALSRPRMAMRNGGWSRS